MATLVAWGNEFDALWVFGFALVLLGAVHLLFRANLHLLPGTADVHRVSDWIIYIILGPVFPFVLAALLPFARLSMRVQRVQRLVRAVAALVALVGATVIAFRGTRWEWSALLCAVLQVGASVWALRAVGWRPRPRVVVLLSTTTVVAWMAAARYALIPFSRWMFASLVNTVVFAGAFALVLAVVLIPVARKRRRATMYDAVLTAVALSILLAGSMRAWPSLKDATSVYHHWGAYIGPAQTVREGGWLLWDVPAQYGFLSTLTLAFFPAPNLWQSLYLLNSLCLLCGVCILYLSLRALRPGVMGNFFALVAAFGAMFMMSGSGIFVLNNTEEVAINGPYSAPSVSALRFIWCYLLLVVLFWEAKGGALGPRRWAVPLGGSLVWLVGCLWSAESAAYSTAIWAPALVFIVLRRWQRDDPNAAPEVPGAGSWRALAWLALPPLLGAGAFTGIELWYLVRLGHAPDWQMYLESALSYADGVLGFGNTILSLSGEFTVLLAVCCIFAVITVRLFQQGETAHRLLPLACGAWGCVWGTGSYYVGHSLASNLWALAPLTCLGIAVALLIVRQWGVHPTALVVRMALMPLLIAQLVYAFGSEQEVPLFFTGIQQGYRGHFERTLPLLTDDQMQLLDMAGVQPHDPIVLFDITSYELMRARETSTKTSVLGIKETDVALYTHPWLPIAPFISAATLPAARNATFIDRYAARMRHGGWLLQRKMYPYTVSPPVMTEAINRNYRVTRTLERGDWQLVYFAYRDRSA